MMDVNQLIEEISVKDVDVDKFVQLVVSDDCIRDEIVKQMVTHPHIMVYYHCYYVVSKASEQRPDLFYRYWPEIAALLKHKNSYHRDFALTIIANLTQVDQEDLFSKIYHDYFEHINDAKFMTGQCCVQNSLKIFRYKPEFREQIIALLLDMDIRCAYPEKQRAVLKSDILDIFDAVYEEMHNKEGINAFIRDGIGSISPKTRRKAKELVRKYDL
ncbi:MAG: hypothetical protein JW963_26515 [Anaerolineales bacterium]|nr:hypothetical protein [Anaerolineales bacterium]